MAEKSEEVSDEVAVSREAWSARPKTSRGTGRQVPSFGQTHPNHCPLRIVSGKWNGVKRDGRLPYSSKSRRSDGRMVDFREQLAKQLAFIRTSCRLYDEGDKNEAYRIAVALRVICHQTGMSTSLLRHLGATRISLLSTCEVIPAEAEFWPNLTNFIINPTGQVFECVPKLANALTARTVPFDDWWNQETVYRFSAGADVRRKKLILSAANQDGGAHVDALLEPMYQKLRDGAGWKIAFRPDVGEAREVSLGNCGVAAIRQMGYEVLNSPALVALAT